MQENKKFRTEMGHFWIKFKNGYTLSIFNGFGSYTENHYNHQKQKEIMDKHLIYDGWDSDTVEIAIISPNGDLCTNDYLQCDDTVKGYVSVDELVDIINLVKNIKGE